LSDQWKLPAQLGNIAKHHHEDIVAFSAQHKPDLLAIVALACKLADALDFGVIPTQNGWSAEKVINYLPDAAKLRFPKDLEALKASVNDRIRALG
jgi:hypothetical protein